MAVSNMQPRGLAVSFFLPFAADKFGPISPNDILAELAE
jgi:hypothetical protein